jgi:hypothetical protein
LRWRRLATAAAAATVVFNTTFSGLPAHAAELAAAPVPAPAEPTNYTRFEQIVERWAINTGFTQGDKTDGADAQTWSWLHPYDSNSQWRKEFLGGFYKYRNRWSNKCLGVESWVIFARVEQQTCDNSQAGQWWTEIFAGTLNGRSTYKIKNLGASAQLGGEWVLTVPHTGIGAPVTLGPIWLADGETKQRWYQSFVRDV